MHGRRKLNVDGGSCSSVSTLKNEAISVLCRCGGIGSDPEVYCDVIIVDILEMVDTSHLVRFGHIRRQGNQAAHFAAHGS